MEQLYFPKKLSDRYTLFNEMRRDRTGIFYKAEDLPSDRIITLKMLYYPQADARTLVDLENTAHRLSQLKSLKRAEILDHGPLKGSGFPYFITTPFLKGQNLTSIINRNKPLEEETAVKLLLPLCRSLRWLHIAGLVHCHLQPDCIFIDRDPFQVLLWTDPYCRLRGKPHLAKSPQNLPPNYLSPEQIRDLIPLDVPSDIYSLGAILYEIVTGQKPYSAQGTSLEIAYRVCSQKALSPRKINPKISQEMEALLSKMMARKPEERYPCMEELIRDLKKYLNRERLYVRPIPETFEREEKAPKAPLLAIAYQRTKQESEEQSLLPISLKEIYLPPIKVKKTPALTQVTQQLFDQVMEKKSQKSIRDIDMALFNKIFGEEDETFGKGKNRKPTTLPGTNIIPFPEPVWEKADWSGSPFRNFAEFLKAIREEYYGE